MQGWQLAVSPSLRRHLRTINCFVHAELTPSIDRASRERRDQSLLPTFNDLRDRGLPNRRRFVFMEETTWPHVPTEWIPLSAYGTRQLSDIVG